MDGQRGAVLTRSQSMSPRPLTKGAGVLCSKMSQGTIRDKTRAVWDKAREAVALGMAMPEVAKRFNLPLHGLRKRAQREEWPTKERILATSPTVEAREALVQSWAEQGEAHRRRIMGIVNRSLKNLNMPAPENWADLERAARIGDRAAGLEKQTPAITLAFPIATSSEGSPFYEAETIFADTLPHPTPEPLEP